MFHSLVVLAAVFSVGFAGSPLFGQCGGVGFTGSTTCDSGLCVVSNAYYSQCLPSTGTTPTAAPAPTTPSSGAGTVLPATFKWSSSGPLVGPKVDSRNITAIKDPSIVFFNGAYHVFASTVSPTEGYSTVYFTFTDFSNANSATFHYLDQTPIGPGYRAAPQVFFMEPQNLWYLIFQDPNPGYSTNTDITNPAGWSSVKDMFSTVPAIVAENSNGWLDMWVICDSANCHLFAEDDNGHLYRSDTSVSNFPNGMSQPVIALSDPNPFNLYEASNVYNIGSEYLLIVECIGTDGRRYFRSWTSPSLMGNWTPYAATQTNPFAGAANVAFSGTPWTDDISHGEMIRTNVDQTMTISTCDMRYFYQGLAPTASGDYNSLPWKLALLTATNSPC